MTVLDRDEDGGRATVEAKDLLEDDEEVDTGMLRIQYGENMERLAATRVAIAKIKRNIPVPEKT